jgi:hypothetical protein
MVLLTTWLEEQRPAPGIPRGLSVYGERDGARATVYPALCRTVKDHFVSVETLERMGFARAARTLETRLPRKKNVRSGDLGEVLATEYIREYTGFAVPINRLRFKDDRDTTMRGDDILGFQTEQGRVRVLKAEAKSRAQLSHNVVGEACASLDNDSMRPNPSSLGFIASMLWEQDREEEAQAVDSLLEAPPANRDVEHLVFTLSGNDPTTALRRYAGRRQVRRRLAGIRIPDHQAFIQQLFDDLHAPNP